LLYVLRNVFYASASFPAGGLADRVNKVKLLAAGRQCAGGNGVDSGVARRGFRRCRYPDAAGSDLTPENGTSRCPEQK
jgi:hypothetical protein